MTVLYDIVNLQFVLILYFLIVYYLRLDVLRSFLVLGHLIAIFLLNDILFDSSYWGDQRRYVNVTKMLREQYVTFQGFAPILEILTDAGSRMALPSLIFALSPIPFINSIQSVAMINFLLYLLSFIYLKKKGISSNYIDFIFLLYPSFFLYSSLALRETLIVLFMILSLYFLLVEEKKVAAGVCLLLLATVKIQNTLIFILAYFVYIFLRERSIKRYLIFFGVGLTVIIFGNNIPLISFFFEKIDYYRWNLIAENFGYNWSFMDSYSYQPFNAGFSMIPLLIKSFTYMFFKPFPWETTNLVQLIQSIENILIIGMIIWLVKTKIHSIIIKKKLIFLNIWLIVSMTIYGLVTFNFGAAARFRFPFILLYLIFYLYMIKSDRLIRKELYREYSSRPSLSLNSL